MSNGNVWSHVYKAVLVLIIGGVVIYQLYLGLTVQKLGIPGVLDIEFGNRIGAPATPVPSESPPAQTESKVWREGDLKIPVAVGNTGRVADLDSGQLLPLGTSLPVRDADLAVKQAVHGVVVEPGVPRGDGETFDARFTRVGDSPAGRDGCAAASVAPKVSPHLLLSSDIGVGSHVCLVTTQGRLAEFEILKVELDGQQRELEARYTVWVSE